MNKKHHKKGNWPDSSEDLLQYLTVHFQIQAAQQRLANMLTYQRQQEKSGNLYHYYS